MLIRVFAALLIILVSLQAQSDTFTPSHYCSKPIKPFQFSSDLDVQIFLNQVNEYELCINNFVQEQDEAMRRHQEAAQNAIDEWNRFVRFELD